MLAELNLRMRDIRHLAKRAVVVVIPENTDLNEGRTFHFNVPRDELFHFVANVTLNC